MLFIYDTGINNSVSCINQKCKNDYEYKTIFQSVTSIPIS